MPFGRELVARKCKVSKVGLVAGSSIPSIMFKLPSFRPMVQKEICAQLTSTLTQTTPLLTTPSRGAREDARALTHDSPSCSPFWQCALFLWDRVPPQNQDLKRTARVTTSIRSSSFPLVAPNPLSSTYQKALSPSTGDRRALDDTDFLMSPAFPAVSPAPLLWLSEEGLSRPRHPA